MKITQISHNDLDAEIQKAKEESLKVFGESGKSSVNMGVVESQGISDILIGKNKNEADAGIAIQSVPVSNDNTKTIENKEPVTPVLSKLGFLNKLKDKKQKNPKNKEKKLGLK